MPDFKYFAYGSNMLLERLKKRCPSAEVIGPATACGYQLSFSKLSKDKSGKATIAEVEDRTREVRGVVFKINKKELVELDKAEGKGKGYDRRDDFKVIMSQEVETVIKRVIN